MDGFRLNSLSIVEIFMVRWEKYHGAVDLDPMGYGF
jgi:hypothetical protein